MKGINQMKDIFLGILDWCITSGIRLVLTVVVVFALWKGIDFILNKFVQSEKFKHLDLTLRKFLRTFIGYTLKVLLIVTAVNFIGINTSSFVAVLAAAGATIGLALQGGLSNLAGGVILILMRPFKSGDFITTAGESGTVVEIGLFYTTLITPDNRKVFLPNGNVTGSAIVNNSSEETRRCDLTFELSRDVDIAKVKKLLKKLADNDERVLADPASRVVITSYGKGTITFSLRAWCKNGDYWDLFFDLQEIVKEAFDISGIVIPNNQVDVHMGEEE
ncbi:MAG: mechanosensitive ion channel [Ruminococcaceae bacterium]|nr:mechanosensitive ion channel [Oscillospiraceae bacterium]